MRLYYRIWVDCLKRLKSSEAGKNNWQIKSIIAMSLPMTFNFVLLMSIFQKQVLGLYFYKVHISLFSDYVNNILTILILFIIPCLIINYLLIFRGSRYEKLIRKYPSYDGKLFFAYFLTSIFLPIILLWIVFS